MFGAKRSAWWRKADFMGEKGCWGVMGVFWGANGVLWDEQVCWR